MNITFLGGEEDCGMLCVGCYFKLLLRQDRTKIRIGKEMFCDEFHVTGLQSYLFECIIAIIDNFCLLVFMIIFKKFIVFFYP